MKQLFKYRWRTIDVYFAMCAVSFIGFGIIAGLVQGLFFGAICAACSIAVREYSERNSFLRMLARKQFGFFDLLAFILVVIASAIGGVVLGILCGILWIVIDVVYGARFRDV